MKLLKVFSSAPLRGAPSARRLIDPLLGPVPLPPRGRNRAARETRGTTMKGERFDIHQHITDQIIAAIERGAGEFRFPWHRSADNIMRPVNVASEKPYRGVNILTLWATAAEKGYTAGTWGTYTQWADTGAQVR